ncbi:MAG: 60S ribosomal protein L22 [Candidatus Helarchaeota archaeon]|nr:60S ribosomal protein L22 [Candidatus Helarchaeota archaeon]
MPEEKGKDISVSFVIDADHLTWMEDRLLNELNSFMETRLPAGSIVDRSGKNILIGFTKSKLNKRDLKTYLKKFLHKFELEEKFHIIATSDEEFKVQKRKGIDFREL